MLEPLCGNTGMVKLSEIELLVGLSIGKIFEGNRAGTGIAGLEKGTGLEDLARFRFGVSATLQAVRDVR